MKKIIVLIIFLLISVFCSGQESLQCKIYPLRDVNLNKGRWILCHTELENMSREVDVTETILDQELLKEVADSFYIIKSSDYFDCASKTSGYRFTLYHNSKYYSVVSYCYPEQVNLGTLKGKFKKARLIKEWISIDNLTAKRDSIHKLKNAIVLQPKQEGNSKKVLVTYLKVD